MKKQDDAQIIEQVKNGPQYEIKTSSASILRKYHAEMIEEKAIKEKNKTKKKYYIFGGTAILSTLALSLTLIVVLNNKSSGNVPSIGNQGLAITNTDLKNELIAFSSFYGVEENNASLKRNAKDLNEKNDNDSNENNEDIELTENQFIDLANNFDSFNNVLKDMDKEIVIEGFEGSYEKEGKTYKFLNKLSYKNETKHFAEIYFNDDQLIEKDEDEVETTYNALYFTDNKYFDLTINEELEADKEEKEIEYSLIFVELQNKTNIFKVEEEQEIKEGSIETYYAYSTFNSLNDLNNDDFEIKRSYKIEKENSKDEIEMKVEYQDKTYEFKDVIYKNNEVEFIANLSSEDLDISDIKIHGEYTKEKRIYKYESYIYEK